MKLTLELSGIPVMLILDNRDIISEIRRKWTGFISTKKPVGKIKIVCEYTNKRFEDEPRENFYFSDNVYVSDNWFNRGRFDFIRNEGTMKAAIRKNELYSIKLFLISVWTIYLLQRQKLLMHACGVEKGGRGYIFPAPSEAGKTTIAEKSREYNIFGDDTVILSLAVDCIEMSSSMLTGQYPAVENKTTTVDSIHFLERGGQLEREEITGTEAFYNLLANTVPFVLFGKKSPDIFIQLLKTVPRYLNIVPCYRLKSSKDDNIWKMIK